MPLQNLGLNHRETFRDITGNSDSTISLVKGRRLLWTDPDKPCTVPPFPVSQNGLILRQVQKFLIWAHIDPLSSQIYTYKIARGLMKFPGKSNISSAETSFFFTSPFKQIILSSRLLVPLPLFKD